MELTQRSVYPLHKVDIPDPEAETVDGDDLDACIRPHYFDMANDTKTSIKKMFVPLSKPNEVQKKCVGVQPDFFHVNESKINAFIKLGIFNEKRKALMHKIKIFE